MVALVLADDLAIAALVVTVGGFGATLWQLWRTKTAANAARDAANSAVSTVGKHQVLVTVQNLRRIEDELDVAVRVETRSTETVLRLLRDWREFGSDIYSTVAADPDESEVAGLLKESFDLASAAKGELVSGSADVLKTTEALREQISRVCNGLGLYTNKLKTDVGGSE